MKNKRILTLIITAMALVCTLFAFSACKEPEETSFTVTFNGSGGELIYGLEVQTVTEASQIVPPEYQKEGYDFSGFDIDLRTITMDTTVNAKWSIKVFKITLDANGGEVGNSVITVNYGENIPQLPLPNNPGYVFCGWQIKGQIGKFITQGMAYDFGKDISVVAVWEEMTPTVFHVTYDMKGGEFVKENPSSFTITDEDILLINPTRTGYVFLGWKEDKAIVPTLTAVIRKGTERDLHFTAFWQVNKYNISFNANGGTVSQQSKTVEYDSNVGILPTPEREGYKFKGWRIDREDGDLLVKETIYKFTQDITAIAVWEEIPIPEYHITYNLDGGVLTNQNPTSYKSTDNDITLNNPEKQGYTFNGWKLEGGDTKQTTVIVKGTEGDLHFTAVWTANRYKIIFDANYGTVNKSYINVVYDREIPALPIPERSGHAFKGWKENGENGKIITQGVIYKKASNTTVVAIWEEIPETVYTISYNMNGADFVEANPTTYKSSDADITLINPIEEGYTFLGWKMDGESQPTLTMVIKKGTQGNLTISAIWQANKYTITFNANGGSVETSNKQVTFNGQVGNLPTPERDGYKFKGWRVESETGELIVKETIYKHAKDITAIAVWEEIPVPEYHITYNLDGGVLNNQNPTSYKPTDDDITLNNPEKLGYTFKGWKIENGGINQTTVIEKGTEGDLHFTAVWVANEYKIYFNANGGKVEIEFVIAIYGNNIPALPIPERKGYVFKGWRAESEVGDSIVQGVLFKQTKDVNAVAVWEEMPIVNYVITYDTDGAKLPDGNPSSYKSTDADIMLNNPVKTGFIFLGWQEKGDESPSTQRVIKSGSIGDLHFTAIWERAKIEINYELTYVTATGKRVTSTVNGQTSISPVVVLYGSSIKDYLYEFTPDTGYRDKCWVVVKGQDESPVNPELELTEANYSGLVFVEEENQAPMYKLTLVAKVFSAYKVTIQTYSYVYNEKIQLTYNGKTEGPVYTVDYNENLGSLLVDPVISAKDKENGVYFKFWYYLKGNQKVKVNSQTLFNSTNIAEEEIVLIPQLYSYWTPVIP